MTWDSKGRGGDILLDMLFGCLLKLIDLFNQKMSLMEMERETAK